MGSDLPKSSDSSGLLLPATSSHPPISRVLCMLQIDIQEGFYRETGFVCCAFLLLCRMQWGWGETMEDGGHRKETVIAEIWVMGTSTTQEAKHNWTLERMRGRRCAWRDSYQSTGHCCEKTHSAAYTAQIQGLVSAASVPGGAHLHWKQALLSPEELPQRRNCPL